MNYGLPYAGSKGSIAEKILNFLPMNNNLYDLFGGGFSITHCALLNFKNKFKNVYANELNKLNVELFKDAISGKYNYDLFKPEFVTRKQFNENKNKCGYIKYIWSFGNNGRQYIFSEEIEKYKHDCHNAVVFNNLSFLFKQKTGINEFPVQLTSIKEKRLFLRKKIEEKFGINEQLEQLERLQRLQQLQQLQQLERLEQLEVTNLDYRDVIIKPNSTIYCDIPYLCSEDFYGVSFDRTSFLNWAANHEQQVFISEYNISDKRFECVLEINKRQIFNKASKVKSVEKIYTQKKFLNNV